MRVLVIGRGPVARVLVTSMAPVHELTLAVREPAADSLLVTTNRLRGTRSAERRVGLTAIDAPARDWDVVISTASPAAPEVARLLGASATVAAVTQVPSEVARLRELAGERPWGLVVPEFFAAEDWWWQPGRFRFTTTGPPSLRSLFARPQWTRRASSAAPLVSAAGMMPVVAGLQAADFDLTAARRAARPLALAATQARNAVAAEFGVRRPKAVRPAAVRAALTVLPRLAPFDVRQHLRNHFGGHSAQTVRMLHDWIELGRRHDLPVNELEALLPSAVAG
ncbi:hypothetical protein SAMN05421837_103561 [Amycolatopsis pretoriensis]|uniref:Uncharacterized protein n=1 Tax=Amycolatopsis pretoriensis TaxID=218821 RepID=A0A1H5QNK6_9PSEU|nr:hypothetical protein [Amycolatopsis pretoriensis]SEF26948.1 hypothetical protein SAMN05421837_103561 [Amycolatopsis pretoriensis]